MNLEDELRSMIKDRFGGVPKFAQQIGVPASSIYTVLNNGISGGSTSTVLPMLAGLGVDANWVIKNKLIKIGTDEDDLADVPLYGSIAAGTPIEMTDLDDTYPIPAVKRRQFPDAFLLKVDGDSMNRSLPNGSYALINPVDEVTHDGKPYAVCVNGYDATIKRVHRLNNGFELVPDSTDPTYQTKTYNFNEPGTEIITVIGEVVWYTLPYDWSF